MIIFDNLTHIIGGNAARAAKLGAYYVPDGSDIARVFNAAYPHVQLQIENGQIIGVTALPIPESDPEIVIDTEQYLLDLDFRLSTMELLGGVTNDL